MVRGVLLDIEGVLIKDNAPISGGPGVIAELRARNLPIRLVSNITTERAGDIVSRLNQMGYAINDGEVVTPPAIAGEYLRSNKLSRVLAFVPESVQADLGVVAANFDDESVFDAVVLGNLNEGATFRKMDQAFAAVMGGARLIAFHRDRFYRGADRLMLDHGSLVAGIQYATGESAVVMGKPAPDFFRSALNAIGCEPGHAIMVGDDLNSDIKGGNATGITTVLALSGKTEQLPDDLDADRTPRHVIRDISELMTLPIWT